MAEIKDIKSILILKFTKFRGKFGKFSINIIFQVEGEKSLLKNNLKESQEKLEGSRLEVAAYQGRTAQATARLIALLKNTRKIEVVSTV